MVSNKLSLANLNNLIDISKFLSIKISSAHKNSGILRLSGNLVGISINLCKSIQKELFINDTP